MINITKWQKKLEDYLSQFEYSDASHDLNHFKRVYQMSKLISKDESEDIDELVLLASAYLHDIVSFAKDDPKRKMASHYASLKAAEILKTLSFPFDKIEAVKHCILTHSYSANITPETIEAKIVQDADRMEAIGAIGLARVFYVSGQMNSSLFHSDDPFGNDRELNDKKYAVDHFYTKLLKLEGTMNTSGGKLMAKKRSKVLLSFLEDLKLELLSN